jgi:hypothetical protein
MSKLGEDGRPVIRDGKVIKSAGFRAPRVADVLATQGWTRR